MSEVLEKKLDKNYGKVQKKELKYLEGSDKVVSSYDKKLKQLADQLKKDYKSHKDVEKQVKTDHKASLKDIKEKYKEETKKVSEKVKEVNAKYKEDIQKADDKNNKSVTKINGLIEKANNDATKLNEKVLKQYEKDVEDCNKEIDSIQKKFEDDTEKATEKFNAKKTKYEEKVATLNEKRDNKVTKLNETSTKKIDKLNTDIEKQRAKADKQLAEMLPLYEEKIAELDGQMSDEKEDYDTKVSNINNTLDEKIARRNKFLEQAENQGDTRAAKLQRKEIKQLRQNTERELKILKSAHDDRVKDFNAKKLEINKNNLEQIAAVEREFTNFKEDALMQIELNKVTLADDITNAKLDIELKLSDELSKFNQVEAKHEINLGDILKEKDLAINEQNNCLAKLEIELEKDNAINAKKLEEELGLRAKELEIAAIVKDQDYKLAQNKLDASLSKTTAEQAILDAQFEQDQIVNEEEELLKLHRNDYDKQAAIKNEFYEAQNAAVEGVKSRVEDLLAYEELEIDNRYNLKATFLEDQRKVAQSDKQRFVNSVENAFAQEEEYFNAEISKLSKKDLDALEKYKEKKEEEIEAIAENKVDLDPKADHRRIKDLNDQIAGVRQEISAETSRVQEAINEKTKVYEANLELAKLRKDKALEELNEVYTLTESDIDAALELLTQNKETELQEVKARFNKSVENMTTFSNYATTRNTVTTDENTKYLNDREDQENAIITDQKQSFEDFRSNTNAEKDQTLANLETQKQEINDVASANTLEQEKIQEAKVNEVNDSISSYEATANQKQNAQANSHGSEIAKIEKVQNDLIAKVENSLRIKDNHYKETVASIDKKANVEKKNYEDEQKRVQKEYDIELKKAITNINKKLEADIKAL